MEVLRTDRLILRRLIDDDAAFVHELMTDPDWLRYIGDRGVRTIADAHAYLRDVLLAMYARHGFGLYRVELRESGEPIGLCGLVRRAGLEDVDVGFAFLPRFRARGFAYEAAAATLQYARATLGIPRIVAIVSPDNDASIRLLRKLGLTMERMIRLTPEADEVCLFGPAPAGSSTAGESDPTPVG